MFAKSINFLWSLGIFGWDNEDHGLEKRLFLQGHGLKSQGLGLGRQGLGLVLESQGLGFVSQCLGLGLGLGCQSLIVGLGL